MEMGGAVCIFAFMMIGAAIYNLVIDLKKKNKK